MIKRKLFGRVYGCQCDLLAGLINTPAVLLLTPKNIGRLILQGKISGISERAYLCTWRRLGASNRTV